MSSSFAVNEEAIVPLLMPPPKAEQDVKVPETTMADSRAVAAKIKMMGFSSMNFCPIFAMLPKMSFALSAIFFPVFPAFRAFSLVFLADSLENFAAICFFLAAFTFSDCVFLSAFFKFLLSFASLQAFLYLAFLWNLPEYFSGFLLFAGLAAAASVTDKPALRLSVPLLLSSFFITFMLRPFIPGNACHSACYYAFSLPVSDVSVNFVVMMRYSSVPAGNLSTNGRITFP